MFEWIFEALKGWWESIVEWSTGLLYGMMDNIASFITTRFPTVDWAELASYAGQLNFLLPIEEAIQLSEGLAIAWSAAIIVRFIRKHTPVVGG